MYIVYVHVWGKHNFLIITNDLEVNSRRKKPFTQISLLITSYCPEITLNPYFDE